MRKNMVTNFENPSGQQFLSQYGYVNYERWCNFEIERQSKNGRRLEIIKNKQGEIALAEEG